MSDEDVPTYRKLHTLEPQVQRMVSARSVQEEQKKGMRRSASLDTRNLESAPLIDNSTFQPDSPHRKRSVEDFMPVKRLASNRSLEEIIAEGEDISPAKQAVIWVKKAQVGSIQWVERCSQEQFYLWSLTKQLKPLWLFAKYGLLVTSVFDEAAPCQGTFQDCMFMDKYQYSMQWDFIPLWMSALFSFCFFGILAGRMVLRKMALREAYDFHSWHKFNGILIGLGMLCCVLYFVSPTFVVISFIIRPLLFVGCTKVLRQTVSIIIRAMPRFIDIILSLFVAVCVFVSVGMVLFVKSPEGLADFKGWADAFSQMWILFTTANDPNAWVAAFNSNKYNFIFFFIYLVVTLYLLLNLLLARVYSAYKEIAIAEVDEFHKNEQLCITRAFKMLSDTGDEVGRISLEAWHAFFVEYCNPTLGGIQVGNPEDTEYNTWRGDLIVRVFHGVDLEAGVGIDLQHFKTILKVFLDREIYIASRKPPNIDQESDFWVTLQTAYLHGAKIGPFKVTWDGLMDFLILIQFAFTFWVVLCYAKPTTPLLYTIPAFWPLFLISCFSALEVVAKICILGLERFWYRKAIQHRFDLITVFPLVILAVLYVAVPGLRVRALGRAIILFNGARAFRLFAYVEPFRKVFLMCTRLIPAYWRMTMMLLIVYFVFAVIGRWMFGGIIYSTNPALAGSPYKEAGFCSLNFNDFGSAFATLFPLMIVNNWYVVANGFLLASHSIWVSIYFVAFFVVCNLIVLNILMALIIDVTMFWSEEEAKQPQKATESHAPCMDFLPAFAASLCGEAEAKKPQRETEAPAMDLLARLAAGMGDDKPEHLLRKVFEKEDQLYAERLTLEKPTKVRSDDELGTRFKPGVSKYGTLSTPV